MMGCGRLECFCLDAKNFTTKTNPLEQAKARKSLLWKKKNEDVLKGLFQRMKNEGLIIKVALPREIKQGMVAKCQGFFVAISFGKGICYCML